MQEGSERGSLHLFVPLEQWIALKSSKEILPLSSKSRSSMKASEHRTLIVGCFKDKKSFISQKVLFFWGCR